jgi:hypothetical protein
MMYIYTDSRAFAGLSTINHTSCVHVSMTVEILRSMYQFISQTNNEGMSTVDFR